MSDAARDPGPGCERHKGDPHNLCQACWKFEPDELSAARARKPRLSARVARLVLARELWANAHGVGDYSAWDDDCLPTAVYERYIERADVLIRDEMEVERA